jgi:hypothetical protein
MAVKYLIEGQEEQAIEQLQVFAKEDNIQYWILLFLEKDPVMAPLKDHPQFPGIVQKIKDRFWKNHTKLKKTLEEKGLM